MYEREGSESIHGWVERKRADTKLLVVQAVSVIMEVSSDSSGLTDKYAGGSDSRP